ncbi:M23 family metallopeptidase [Parasphingorhabdus pacifica]
MRLLIVAALATPLLVSAAPPANEPVRAERSDARPAPARPRYGWPLAPTPPTVSRPFERPPHTYGPGHRGVDLTGTPGQPVLAAGDGLVLFAGRVVDRDLVSIEHLSGLRTTYEPVAPSVQVGDLVSTGDPIGHLQPGHPECAASGPTTCLHWGARRRLDYLDPLRLLGTGGVRLLPWNDDTGRRHHG